MNHTYDEAPMRGSIRCGYMKDIIKKESTNRIHCHPYAELMVIRQGDVIYTARGETRRLVGKCIIYNPTGTIHNQFVQDHHLYERYKICFYTPDLPASEQESALLSEALALPLIKELEDEDFDLIYTLCKDIASLSQSIGTDALAATQCRISLILILLRVFAAKGRQTSHGESYIAEVVKYISRHLKENLRIETIAATFFVSKSKLNYDFRAYCNMSIHEYITMERVEQAKELLVNGYLVSATAEKLGFSSSSYFIKVFTAVTGTTPLQWQLRQANALTR